MVSIYSSSGLALANFVRKLIIWTFTVLSSPWKYSFQTLSKRLTFENTFLGDETSNTKIAYSRTVNFKGCPLTIAVLASKLIFRSLKVKSFGAEMVLLCIYLLTCESNLA